MAQPMEPLDPQHLSYTTAVDGVIDFAIKGQKLGTKVKLNVG